MSVEDCAPTYNTFAFEQLRLSQLIAKHGLEFTYVRQLDHMGNIELCGGCVIAWTWPKHKQTGTMIEIAISWCHKNDNFDKKLGRFLAATAFDQGNRIKLRLPCAPVEQRISTTLKELFGQCV